jgi:MFS transporter, Spinster family, sphingosine-1-phosphate transporter
MMKTPEATTEIKLQGIDGKVINTNYTYYALGILTLLNLLNYIDRFIFSALIPNIKEELHFTDQQFGLLGGAFTIVYTLLSPIYGYLADRRARVGLISSGIAIWSFATAGAGLAQDFTQMLIARAAVGIGEASYATISPGFLSDYFARHRRGVVLGIFFTAIPVGQALGYILAGVLGKPELLGWRHTFFVVGIPGLLMALAAHFLREPQRGTFDETPPVSTAVPPANTPPAANASVAAEKRSIITGYFSLLSNYHYMMATLGYAAITFALGALSFWGIELLVSNKGLSKETANVQLGIYVTLGGVVGTLAGGWLGDQLLRRYRGGYFLLCGVSSVLATTPLVIVLVTMQQKVLFPTVFIAVCLLFLGNGPINAIIVNSVPPDLRSTAIATTTLAIHFLGDALSQPLIGTLSTWLANQPQWPGFVAQLARLLGVTPQQSLTMAMLITPLALLVAAGCFFLGMRQPTPITEVVKSGR